MPFSVVVSGAPRPGVMPWALVPGASLEGEVLWARKGGQWREIWRREIVFINDIDRVGASIFELMGSPSKAGRYVFINRATIRGGASGYALRTGVFPVGSTLTLINEGAIRGAGGLGAYPGNALPGRTALLLDFPTVIENNEGLIFGGGGGGGYSYIAIGGGVAYAGGGGGAGLPGGGGGSMFQNATSWGFASPAAGSPDAGGAGGVFYGGNSGGAGGAPGAPGVSSSSAAGAAGAAIDRAGNALVFPGASDAQRVKGAIL